MTCSAGLELPGLPPPAPPLKALGMHDDRGGRLLSWPGEVRRCHGHAGGTPSGGAVSADRLGEWVGIGSGTCGCRRGLRRRAQDSSAPEGGGAGWAESYCPRVALRSTRGYNPSPRWGEEAWIAGPPMARGAGPVPRWGDHRVYGAPLGRWGGSPAPHWREEEAANFLVNVPSLCPRCLCGESSLWG